MQLSPDGPDIPLELFHAQEEERLVFFCGAGISRPAGLPDFKGLVGDVISHLRAELDDAERSELSTGGYDRVLGLLERSDRYGSSVRERVISRLQQCDTSILETHQALVALGTRPDGSLQMVTTNFDRLFELASPTAVLHDAPLLPIPKPDKWDGLVHLHGRITRADPTGRRMVLTSADFGVAYLVERWAARFVSELFEHFDVVFVGYGVNDPVMRYLVDAVAAERRSDSRLHRAYALAEYDTLASQQWRAKGIEPVLYDPKDDHSVLRKTLVTWATRFNSGLDSKIAIVSALSSKEPAALGSEDRQHFCWALSDNSGAPAKKLLHAGTAATFDWIRVLEEPFAQGLSPGFGSRGLGLVGPRAAGSVDLDPVRALLAHWLCQHAGSVDSLEWVLERGGQLHPALRSRVLHELFATPTIPTVLREAWRLVVTAAEPAGDVEHHDLPSRVSVPGWSASLMLSVLRAFTPRLDFDYRRGSSRRRTLGTLEERVDSLLHVTCTIGAHSNAETILDALSARPDWPQLATELLPRVDPLLRYALELLVATGQVRSDLDSTYLDKPSIAPHGQNHDQDWIWLIEFARRCVEGGGRGASLAAVTSLWAVSSFSILRRLWLHTAHVVPVLDPSDVAEVLLSDPLSWLWDVRLQVELFPLLGRLRAQLPAPVSAKLIAELEAGPPHDMLHESTSTNDIERRRDRMIFDRLSRFLEEPDGRGESESLRRITDEHPDWPLNQSERDAFVAWFEIGWGHATDVTIDMLASMDDAALAAFLAQRREDEGAIDRWQHLANSEPARAIGLLARLVGPEDARPALVAALMGVRDAATTDAQKLTVLDILAGAPLDQGPQLFAATELIRNWAGGDDSRQQKLLTAIRALQPLALTTPFERRADLLSAALATPAGGLAESLLSILDARQLTRQAGLPDDLSTPLTAFFECDEPGAAPGRILIASRLAPLYDVDPSWTGRYLIPCFDWIRPAEATGCWQGFLWSPWVRPSLWRLLFPSALETLNHLAALDSHREAFVRFLMSIGLDGGGIEHREMRAILRRLEIDDLAVAARWFARRLRDSGGDDKVWTHAATWLAEVWPTEGSRKDASVSSAFAGIAISQPRRFVAAVDMVFPHLVAAEYLHPSFADLPDHGVARTHPRVALRFVSAITPDNPRDHLGFGSLVELLDQLRAADPGVTTDPDYVRLRNIATRVS